MATDITDPTYGGGWWGSDPSQGAVTDESPGSTVTDTYDIPGFDPTNPGYPGDPSAPGNLYPDAPPDTSSTPGASPGGGLNLGSIGSGLSSLFGGGSGLANLGVYGGIGALGLYEAGKARDETKQYGATLQKEGQPFYDAATGALQRYQTGTLMPWQSAQIQDFISSSDQQVKQILSQNGMVDSTVLAGQTQQIQRQAMEMTGQFIDQNMKDSISLLGAAQPFLMGAVNTAMQADQQYAKTVQEFLGSLAQAYAYQAAGQAGNKAGGAAGGGGILGAAGGLLNKAGGAIGDWLGGAGGAGSTAADVAGAVGGIGAGAGISGVPGGAPTPDGSVSVEPGATGSLPSTIPIGIGGGIGGALGGGVPAGSISVEGLTGATGGAGPTAVVGGGAAAAPEAPGVLSAGSTSEAIGNAIATGGPIAVAALIAYGFADAIGKWTAGNPQGNVTRDWNQMLGGVTPSNAYQWLQDGVDAKQFTRAQADQMWATMQRDAAADPNYWNTLTQHLRQSTDAVNQSGRQIGSQSQGQGSQGTTEPQIGDINLYGLGP